MAKKKPAKKPTKPKGKPQAKRTGKARKRAQATPDATRQAPEPADAAGAKPERPETEEEERARERGEARAEMLELSYAQAPARDPITEAAETLRERVLEAAGYAGVVRRGALASREAWGRVFIEALRACGCPTVACRLCGVPRTTAYNRRASDPAFAKEWAAAIVEATDALIVEARRRAVDGWDEPVFGQFGVKGFVRKFDSKLLQFLLSGLRPKTFRVRKEVKHKIENAVTPGDRDGLYASLLSRSKGPAASN